LLREILNALNNKVMKRAGGLPRNEKFLQCEKELLQPLPSERLSYLDPAVNGRFAADYHVSYDNVHYSLDNKLINQEVSVRSPGRDSPRQQNCGHPSAFICLTLLCQSSQHRPANHNSYLNDKIEDWAASQHPEIADWALACVPIKAARRDKERILVRLRNAKQIFGQDRLVLDDFGIAEID
jgi:hypothetical protein